MKANELMIGDWVMYDPNTPYEHEDESPEECFPIKIESGENIDLAVEGCFSSIPLTKEILEKNGFVYTKPSFTTVSEEMVWHLENYRHQWKIDLEEQEDDSENKFYILYIYCCTKYIELPIDTVHELQHALNLLGIKKRITL